MKTMFDTLLQLPLFQGLCQEDLTNILNKVKLHFVKYKAGEILARSNTPCHQLCFLLKGELSVCTVAKDQSYTVIEQVTAPYLIEPQSLFGMHTTHMATYTAQTEVHTVCIDKFFVLEELLRYEIFRLNYMNILSSRAQIYYNRVWERTPQELVTRIIHFFVHHCERSPGKKLFKIKMEDLARHTNSTRLNISKALNALQEAGLVELRRKEIIIPNIDRLSGL